MDLLLMKFIGGRAVLEQHSQHSHQVSLLARRVMMH